MVLKFRSIVLTDDDEDDRCFFQEALDSLKLDISCQLFEDGLALMNYLKSSLTHLPSILFLDLNMPKKSGIECLMEIRSNNILKDIFIIIYSTSNSDRDVLKSYELGADKYFFKPSSFTNLKTSLFHILTTLDTSNTNKGFNNFLLKFN